MLKNMKLKSNPLWVNNILTENSTTSFNDLHMFASSLAPDLKRFAVEDPTVSIVIPAYNEEKNILHTLKSLSASNITMPTEIIVVNNKSTDRTKELLDAVGIKNIQEPMKGISYARQAGLLSAKGKFILSADADTFYHPNWIQAMMKPLMLNPEITLVYGDYKFIAENSWQRINLSIIELISMHMRRLREFKRNYLNVLGFNFAMRKDDALAVGGFDTSKARWSDGRLAMSLASKGELYRSRDSASKVYTWPRRLLADGSLSKALINRCKKEVNWLPQHLGVIPPKTPTTKSIRS